MLMKIILWFVLFMGAPIVVEYIVKGINKVRIILFAAKCAIKVKMHRTHLNMLIFKNKIIFVLNFMRNLHWNPKVLPAAIKLANMTPEQFGKFVVFMRQYIPDLPDPPEPSKDYSM